MPSSRFNSLCLSLQNVAFVFDLVCIMLSLNACDSCAVNCINQAPTQTPPRALVAGDTVLLHHASVCRVDALTGVTLVCLQATDLLLLASVSPWQEGRIPRVRKVTPAPATRAPLTVSHLMVSYPHGVSTSRCRYVTVSHLMISAHRHCALSLIDFLTTQFNVCALDDDVKCLSHRV